jgi:hypothetical protein
MREITLKVYPYNELSESAKEKAFERWLNDPDIYVEDLKETLESFKNIFPIKIKDWEFDANTGYIDFDMTCEDDTEELTGVRLATYLYNNFWNDITAKKYYWTAFKQGKQSKSRHSKISIVKPQTGACPLTGTCYDDIILGPIFEFIKNPDADKNFYDVIRECLDKWIDAGVAECEHQTSKEFFEDETESNEWEYYENGVQCY